MTIAVTGRSHHPVSANRQPNWTHGGGAAPKGVIVLLVGQTASSTFATHQDEVIGVNYGGLPMTEVPGSPLIQSLNGPSPFDPNGYVWSDHKFSIHAFYVSGCIPIGNQLIVVDTNGQATFQIYQGEAYSFSSTLGGIGVEAATTNQETTAFPSLSLTSSHTGIPLAVMGYDDTPTNIASTGSQTPTFNFDYGVVRAQWAEFGQVAPGTYSFPYHITSASFTPDPQMPCIELGVVVYEVTDPACPTCISVSDFGYFSSADGAPVTPGGGEASGFVEAGETNLTFQASPINGSLIIAWASRWHMNSGSVPSTGTMSGFGASWDQIYSQSGSGNGNAGFTEVYRAQQSSYATPDRIRYTFPAGSTGDLIYSSVGWMSYLGTEPAGLSDNGASAIRNVTHQGPTSGLTANYTQGPASSFLSPSSLWFNAYWELANGESDFFDFWNSGIVVPGSGIGSPSSGRATVPPPPQWNVNENIHTRRPGAYSMFWWEAGFSRTWWACTFEIKADPVCSGVVLYPYWGILNTPG